MQLEYVQSRTPAAPRRGCPSASRLSSRRAAGGAPRAAGRAAPHPPELPEVPLNQQVRVDSSGVRELDPEGSGEPSLLYAPDPSRALDHPPAKCIGRRRRRHDAPSGCRVWARRGCRWARRACVPPLAQRGRLARGGLRCLDRLVRKQCQGQRLRQHHPPRRALPQWTGARACAALRLSQPPPPRQTGKPSRGEQASFWYSQGCFIG